MLKQVEYTQSGNSNCIDNLGKVFKNIKIFKQYLFIFTALGCTNAKYIILPFR